ncbi:MAG: hypothetical protein QF408_15965, partial [Pirellulales bacterium]|nr:hypothetical protein [Pirellulales bacterium]
MAQSTGVRLATSCAFTSAPSFPEFLFERFVEQLIQLTRVHPDGRRGYLVLCNAVRLEFDHAFA